NPDLGRSSPWHFTQETSKIGLMSVAKVTFALVAAGGSFAMSIFSSWAFALSASVSAARRGINLVRVTVLRSFIVVINVPKFVRKTFLLSKTIKLRIMN